MNERELIGLIEHEVQNSIGGQSGDLAMARADDLKRYNAEPYGDEKEGESQVVSSDVFDAVESVLPSLIKTFTASDDAVVFDPVGAEDEEEAKQKTELCNYVFYRQNNGFLVLYEWIKDALIQKNGVVKYWWEEKKDVTKESYQGLTEGQYYQLKNDDGVAILSESAYPDEDARRQKDEQLALALKQIDARGAQLPPEAIAAYKQRITDQLNAIPVPNLHDVEVEITKDVSQIRIESVPPEEFGISAKHKCVSIQDTPFCYHETKKSISDLRAMGCPDDVIERAGTSEDRIASGPEALARNRFADERRLDDPVNDPSLREVVVRDCFVNVDENGDGIAERRRIVQVGNAIWIDEEEKHINFAAITPVIMPHRWVGKSLAEIVKDFQRQFTVLWRQMLNNLYLTNHPRKIVLGNQAGMVQANVDQLMTSRVGGIMTEFMPNAIRNEEIPFVAAASFPMLEYMEGKKEQRTGVTRYNQGTDADSLNKTARGIAMIQSASQEKRDLMARIIAETGVKDLFKGVAYLLSKYPSKPMALKLRGKWVDINPREWSKNFNVIANVGLGTGNKDAQLVHLVKMNEIQLELIKEGRGYMVTDQNVFNLATKMSENMGFKHPELFITDPANTQKPPQGPNPDMLKIQQADAEAKMKIQSNEKIRQFDAQTQGQLEQIKAQTQISIAQINAETSKWIASLQANTQAQIALYKTNNGLENEKQQLEVEKIALTAEKNLLTIQKGAEGELKAIQDAAAVPPPEPPNVAETIAPILEKHADSIRTEQQKLASSIAALAVSHDETKKVATAPRIHKVRKVADGYEITSTVH